MQSQSGSSVKSVSLSPRKLAENAETEPQTYFPHIPFGGGMKLCMKIAFALLRTAYPKFIF